MTEPAVLERPSAETEPPPPNTQINSMAEKLKGLMVDVAKPAPPEKPLDTRPKPLPELKKEPLLTATVPPTEAKPPEPKPVEQKPAPQAKDKNEAEMFSSPHWKELVASRDDWKSKTKEAAKEVETYKAKVAELETKVAKPEEIEALKKERQDALDKLERISLEHSDKFSSYYNSKFEQAVAQAVDSVGKDKADQIKAILEAPKSAWRKAQLNEIVSTMESEVDKLQLISAMTDYDRVRGEKEKQLEDWRNNSIALRKANEQQQREAQEQDMARRKAFASRALSEQAIKLEAFQEKEGDKDHNANVAKARKLVEDFVMGNMDDSLAISLPIKAAEYDRVSKLIPELQAKIKEQEEALAAYKQSAPRGGELPPGQKPSETTGKTFKERVMEMMPKTP